MKQALAHSRGLSSYLYGFSHCFLTIVVLIAYGNTCVVFAKPDQGSTNFKNDACV